MYCGVLLKVMLLMTGVDATLMPLAQMDSRPVLLCLNLCEFREFTVSEVRFHSRSSNLGQALSH